MSRKHIIILSDTNSSHLKVKINFNNKVPGYDIAVNVQKEYLNVYLILQKYFKIYFNVFSVLVHNLF